MVFFSPENHLDVCDVVLFLNCLQQPHANRTIIYENIKEIHIFVVGGILEFPILSQVLFRRDFMWSMLAVLVSEFR